MRAFPISLLFILFYLSFSPAGAQEVTTDEARYLYGNTSKRRVSIHDPSVVYNHQNQRYYIVGSHKVGAYTTDFQNWTQANPTWKVGANNNAANKDAFVTPAVKTVKKGGVDVDFPAFNAVDWSARSQADYNVDGNMWAPDVIWNTTMQKWCMYLSINGDAWHSSIILLTADAITGPYTYQGPVVTCGFYDTQHSYKDADLELVLGTQSSLPSRYNVGNKWGNRWPHTIDPAVFYDEEGKLWLVYGSWSGGIWMLELDEETGLRDYDVTYPSTNGSNDAVTSDPYFGKKIAGGRYVSGEGPYIEHIGNYYYLFVSYGFYSPDGGYEMRVFRSQNPNGPYLDARGNNAIFSTYAMNYGKNGDTRGEKLMGAYNGWGFQTVGECAQGHNSVIAAADGRTYLVYHTKFNNGTAGHQVRVHQLFVNKDGWLVAAPFEYNGEQITDADNAQTETLSSDLIPGIYQLLVHKYGMDYANYEEVKPVSITLAEDGKVTGSRTGTWSREEGTNYFNIVMGGTTYKGVVYEEQMDTRSTHAVAFTAASGSGVNVWGYKMHPKYAVAWQLNNQKVPVQNNQQVKQNLDLDGMDQQVDNVLVEWESDQPDIISAHGRYNPTGLTEDTPVGLSVRVSSCGYYWTQDYTVQALSEENAKTDADVTTGLLAHYGFDNGVLTNTLDATQQAELQRYGTTKLPALVDDDPLRTGSVVHLSAGANGRESFVSMPNPLYAQTLDKGATLAFWVKRTDNNLWDALYAFVNGDARLYMTGNLYTGFNDGAGHWLDINHPEAVQPTNLTVGKWHHVVVTFSSTATASTGGVTVYIDGNTKRSDTFNGELDGTAVTSKKAFEYQRLLDLIAASQQLYLGRGSFWGSPDALFDDVMVYNRTLSLAEVMGLKQMVNRVFNATDFGVSGIETVNSTASSAANGYYDLQGRRVERPSKGLYIVGGKKVFVR